MINENPELIELLHAFLSWVSYWDNYDKYEYNIITDFVKHKKETKVEFRWIDMFPWASIEERNKQWKQFNKIQDEIIPSFEKLFKI